MGVVHSLGQVMQLRHGVTYRAPSGRLCTLSPASSGLPVGRSAVLMYRQPDGQPAAASSLDSFTLACFNWYLLKAVC